MMDPLTEAFARQSRACADLGSPFMAALMAALPHALPMAPQLHARLALWPGPPGPDGASLPLRLAGGLHALVRSGTAPDLAALYPPGNPDPAALGLTLSRHEPFLLDWIESPPQTNETGRSAILIPVAQMLSRRFGLPLTLSELGASAGLNLRFDAYTTPTGPLSLSPDWQGPRPADTPFTIADRRGVDLNPLDPVADGARLLAYVWPDQTARLARLQAALALAATLPAPVDRADAADWLDQRLTPPREGTCHLVFHTIAFQYFSPATQARITKAMHRAGKAATPTAPLAWAAMEADGGEKGARITLRLWPGNRSVTLGRAGFHGQWVNWRQPRLD